MASITWTFSAGQTWHFTGSAIQGGTATSSVSASIECWGAGGHGNRNGTGGSGGAYAAKMFTIRSGSYKIVVGSGAIADGGSSSFYSGSDLIVAAAGGKMDGTVTHQLAASTGSTIYVGGVGGANFEGYSADCGGGGGGCAGALGNGEAGQSGFYAQPTAPASGGLYNNTGATANGGNGAYYYAGAGVNQIFPATTGDVPGCGGGGGYDYPEGSDSSAAGGDGYVSILLQG